MTVTSIVLIALNAIFALCILFGFLWGLKRGVKRSALRIGIIAGCLILAFFVAMPVTSSLLNMDISSIVTYTDSNGEVQKTFNDIISSAITDISPDVKEAYDNSESLRALVDALPQMILQCLIFVLLFWIFKCLTWPIFAIIAKCAWGRKKKEQTAQETAAQPKTVESGRVVENGNTRPVPPKKEKKHRLGGAMVGLAQGFVIALFTLVPIAGVSSIVKDVEAQASTVEAASETSSDSEDMKPLVEMLRESLGDDIVDSLTAYEDSVLGVMCGWTGVDDLMFDIGTSAKVGDKSTNLRKEINAISNAYAKVIKIKSFDLSKMDFDSMQQLFEYLISSPSISSIADELMPYYINKVINDSSSLDPTIKELLTMYVDAYGTPKIAELKEDIGHICTALKIIQSNDVFAYVENANPFDLNAFLDIIQSTEEKNPLRDIFAEVTKSTTTQKILQTFINYGLKQLGDTVSKETGKTITVKTVTFENVNWDKVSADVPEILNTAIDIYREFDADTSSETRKVLNVDFVSVGKILDLFTKSSLLEDAFDSAMDILEQYDEYSKYISFAGLKNNVNFTQEFTYVQNAIDEMESAGALDYFNDGTTIEIADFIKSLNNKSKDSTLTHWDVIFNNITASSVLQSSLPKTLNTVYPDVLKDLSDNIAVIDTTSINWNTENATFKQLAKFVSENIDTFTNDVTAKSVLNNVDVAQIGVNLDAMKASALLLPVAKAGIDYAKTNEGFKEYLNSNALSINLNFTNEFASLAAAIAVAKESGIMDKVLDATEQMTKDILTILNNDQTIATDLIDNLFDSTIMQQSVELLVNRLQKLIGEALSITIEATTVDIDDFTNNLSTKKTEFSNILNSIAKIGSPVLDSTFTLDVFADNIDNFTNAFVALQASVEFHNTYRAILDYLAANEQIKDVIDFTVIGDDFDYTTEFGKLKDIIQILKDNNIWTPLVDGTGTVEDLVDTLGAEAKEAITQKILESKLFVGYATQALNNMIDEFNDCLGTSVAHIPDDTDLSTQSENIAKVTRYLSNIDTTAQINLKTIDKTNLGNLLNELKKNKFELSGALTGIYDAFVDYMVDDTKSDYGYIIQDACDSFNSTATSIAAKGNANVDWTQITGAFDELLTVYDNLGDINNLTAETTITVFNAIGTSENTLVARLVKTYLKHDVTDASKISAIDEFDFSDTEFNSSAIATLYNLKDVSDAISASDTDSALTSIDTILETLDGYDTTKLNKLVAFIDAVTDKDISSYITGVNFATERACITKMKTLLNHTGKYTLDLLNTAIDGIVDSTLILSKLHENNIVICDVDSPEIMDDLIEDSNGLVTSDQIITIIREAISTKTSDTTKQTQIASILGITMA